MDIYNTLTRKKEEFIPMKQERWQCIPAARQFITTLI